MVALVLRRDRHRPSSCSSLVSNAQTVYVGSFLIVFAAFGGLELDGLTGALLFVLGVVLLVAIIDEIGREEVAEALADAAGSPGTPDVRRRG